MWIFFSKRSRSARGMPNQLLSWSTLMTLRQEAIVGGVAASLWPLRRQAGLASSCCKCGCIPGWISNLVGLTVQGAWLSGIEGPEFGRGKRCCTRCCSSPHLDRPRAHFETALRLLSDSLNQLPSSQNGFRVQAPKFWPYGTRD